jgi:hypothetical protein
MQPEPVATQRSAISRRPTRRRLSLTGPITVLPRALDAAIYAALDTAPVDLLPFFRVREKRGRVVETVRKHLATSGFRPAWLADWLADDIGFLARLFHEVVEAPTLRVRLEVVTGDACTQFHADNVRHRLVSTYRGPGTEWISPRAVATTPAGAPLPDDSIRRLNASMSRSCAASVTRRRIDLR